MAGSIAVLNCGRGDLKVSFSSDNPVELDRARRMIEDMIRRGYIIFIEDKDKNLTRVDGFDPSTNSYFITDVPAGSETTPISSTTVEVVKKKSSRKKVPIDAVDVTAIPPVQGGAPNLPAVDTPVTKKKWVRYLLLQDGCYEEISYEDLISYMEYDPNKRLIFKVYLRYRLPMWIVLPALIIKDMVRRVFNKQDVVFDCLFRNTKSAKNVFTAILSARSWSVSTVFIKCPNTGYVCFLFGSRVLPENNNSLYWLYIIRRNVEYDMDKCASLIVDLLREYRLDSLLFSLLGVDFCVADVDEISEQSVFNLIPERNKNWT